MLLRISLVVLGLALASASARAQQAPLPMEANTVVAAPTVLSTTGDVAVTTGGLPAVGLTIQGTASGLAAAVQGQQTPNGSWTTIPAIPLGGGAAVTSISANGSWTVNVSQYSAVRLHVTALVSGNATVVFGGANPMAITVVNPDGSVVGAGSSGVTANQGAAGTQAWPVSTTPAQSTPAAPDISSVTTGGTPVNAFSAGHCAKGCYVSNPDNATQNLCANGVGTASGVHTNGATICAGAGQSIPFSPRSGAISVVSSDSLHAFGGEGYQ